MKGERMKSLVIYKTKAGHTQRYAEMIAYAWSEHIDDTNLFVGRKKEFDYFLGDLV